MAPNAGLENKEQPMKWEVGNVINQIHWVMSCHQYLDTDQVSRTVVELKTALYKGQTREQILRKSGLHCIDYWRRT